MHSCYHFFFLLVVPKTVQDAGMVQLNCNSLVCRCGCDKLITMTETIRNLEQLQESTSVECQLPTFRQSKQSWERGAVCSEVQIEQCLTCLGWGSVERGSWSHVQRGESGP